MSSKVFINRPDMAESVLAILRPTCELDVWTTESAVPRDELLRRVAGKHGLFIGPSCKVDGELLDAAGDQLKVIATMSVGLDHIDVGLVRARGIRLGYTAGVLDDAVAELTVALLLSRARRLFEGRQLVAEGRWPGYVGWHWMNGSGLKGAVVGVVGMGRIGLEVALRLAPFKVGSFLYTSRSDKPGAARVGALKTSLEDLLRRSDFVIVTCALSSETHHLIGQQELGLMKKSAILVNTSRGQVVDQEALIAALRAGTIAGAALDVMTPEPLPADHDLLTLPNCYVIPHLGSAETATRDAMADVTAKNLLAGLEGTQMPVEFS